MHRLVSSYASKIAPDPKDPLHLELRKLPPVPDVLYRPLAPFAESTVRMPIRVRSSSSGTSTCAAMRPSHLSMSYTSRLENFNLRSPDKHSSKLFIAQADVHESNSSYVDGDDQFANKVSMNQYNT